jgi:Flp pilus assembly protein TadB
VKKFFSNSLNVTVLIVVVLWLCSLISMLAGFGILGLTVLFHIEDHLRTIKQTLAAKTNLP